MSFAACLVILMTSFSLARAEHCTVSSYPELCLAMADPAKVHCATFVVRGGGQQAANATAMCEVRRSVTIECDASAAPWVCDPQASCILVTDAMSVAVRGCRMLGHGVNVTASSVTDVTLEDVSIDGLNTSRCVSVAGARSVVIRGSHFRNGFRMWRDTPWSKGGGGAIFLNKIILNIIMEDSTVADSATLGGDGGGFSLMNSGFASVRNVTVCNCSSRPIMHADLSSSTGVSVNRVGGGFSVGRIDRLVLDGIVLQDNTAFEGQGGGGYFDDVQSVVVKNTRIERCRGVSSRITTPSIAGALYLSFVSTSSSVFFVNLTVVDCSAYFTGGVILDANGGSLQAYIQDTLIHRCNSSVGDACLKFQGRIFLSASRSNPTVMSVRIVNSSLRQCNTLTKGASTLSLNVSDFRKQYTFATKGLEVKVSEKALRLVNTRTRTTSYRPTPSPRKINLSRPVRRIIDPAFTFTSVALSTVMSSASFDTIQTLGVLGMSDCSSDSLRHLSDEAGWTLSPLYRIIGPGPYISEPPSVTPILANMFLGIGVFAIHGLAAWAGGAVRVMFPAVSLIVGGMLVQGTTYYAVRHFSGPSAGTGWDVVPVMGLLGIPFGLFAFGVHFHMHFGLPQSQFVPYIPSVVDTTWWRRLLLPRGFHSSLDITNTHFPLFDNYIPECHRGILVRYATLILIGIVTAIPNPNCGAVVASLTAIFVVTALYNLIRVPTRVRHFAIIRGFGLLLNAAIACIAYLTEGTAEDIIACVSNVIMVLSVVDFVVMCYGVYWDWVWAPSATPKQEECDPPGADNEMQLLEDRPAPPTATMKQDAKIKAVGPIDIEL